MRNKNAARCGPKVNERKTEHITICVSPQEKAQIEAAAANAGTSASPLIHRYMFTQEGALRTAPDR